MGFKLTSSGKLSEELQRRAAEFAGRKIAAAIQVPEDMSWWYYQEFGTATHAEQGTDHPEGYTIDPVSAGALRLPVTGEHPTALLVPHVGPNTTSIHPGVSPKHMVTRVLDDIVETAQTEIVTAMQEGNYSLDPVHTALTESMQIAKEAITTSFDEQLPGQRTDPEGAKLSESAAATFADNAEIVDLSE